MPKPLSITIMRPPTLDTTMKYLSMALNHEQGRALLTPIQAHKVAAWLFAANQAYFQDCVHPSFSKARQNHKPLEAGAVFERMLEWPVYKAHNNPPQVEVDFREHIEKQRAKRAAA